MWLVAAALAGEPEEIEVVGDPLDPSESSASVTVIAVDEQIPASADLADVVSMAPGTVVQRLGGLGDWSAVSIRGSTARQVEVFLDGIPLNPDGASVVNLSELPLRSFERVEIYRGGAPPELGASAIGGVVNLVSGEEPARSASIGAGSFRTVRAHGAWSGALPVGEAMLAGEALSTRGDFRWFDPGELYDATDDRFRTRRNNDRAQGTVHGRWRVGDDTLRFTLLNAFMARESGVPGYTADPADTVRVDALRDLQVLEMEGSSGSFRGSSRVWGLFRQDHLDDRHGEIGVAASDSVDHSRTLGIRTAGRVAPRPWLAGFGSLSVRGDRYQHTDRLTGIDADPRGRLGLNGALSGTLLAGHDRFALTPIARVLWLSGSDPLGDTAPPTVELTPAVGARWQLLDGLVLKGNAGRYVRPPDLTELYGDRGAIVGNPALASETGLNADLGAQLRLPTEGPVTGTVEAAGFWTASTDRIALVQNAQGVAQPFNLQDTRLRGVEGAIATVWFERVETFTNLTRTWATLRSANPFLDGNQIPRIPAWEAHQRTALVLGPVRLGHRFDFADGTFGDELNLDRAAPRRLHGAFLRVQQGPFSVEADVANLTDTVTEEVPVDPLVDPDVLGTEPVTDFLGYPLPGRTFLLTLRWDG